MLSILTMAQSLGACPELIDWVQDKIDQMINEMDADWAAWILAKMPPEVTATVRPQLIATTSRKPSVAVALLQNPGMATPLSHDEDSELITSVMSCPYSSMRLLMQPKASESLVQYWRMGLIDAVQRHHAAAACLLCWAPQNMSFSPLEITVLVEAARREALTALQVLRDCHMDAIRSPKIRARLISSLRKSPPLAMLFLQEPCAAAPLFDEEKKELTDFVNQASN